MMATISAPGLAYRLLSFALLPVWIIHAARLAWQTRCSPYFWQRLGLLRPTLPEQSVWLHAASVGEAEMIRPLVQRLSQTRPVVVSCFTATGYLHAREQMPPSVQVIALPIDCWPLARRFVRRHRFALALIAETELWPELLYQTRRQAIPLLQINARLSDKSLSTSGWRRRLLQRSLQYFDHFITRGDADIISLTSMGVDRYRITICGNLKYAASDLDPEPAENLIERPYLLFASTHAPEEQLFAQIHARLESPPLFVIAPRHPVRAEEIRQTLQPLGLQLSQRSLGEAITDDTDIYLADTLGEMKPLMQHAILVVMGGSFCDVGGHNILEPARLSCAVITGGSDGNIRSDIERLQADQAILQVESIEQLVETIQRLLQQPAALNELRHQAQAVMKQQTGILDCYCEKITGFR